MIPFELKRKWLEALRSGSYEQGRTYLKYTEFSRQRNSWCCLGVLCKVAELKQENRGDGVWVFSSELDSTALLLPLGFRSSIGVTSEQELLLSAMNDHGTSFLEIADWIEKNL